MTFSCLSIILLVLLTTTVAAHRPVATYIINLDLQPSERYTELISNTSNGFNTTVWAFYNKYFANDKILTVRVLIYICTSNIIQTNQIPILHCSFSFYFFYTGRPL